MFIDRFGPRRIGIAGIALYCVALASLSFAGPSYASWLALWAFMAVALLNTKPTVWIAAVTGLFDRSRGLAIACVLSATGLSQAITPIVTNVLVDRYGWRGAYLALAGGGALLALPLLWMFFSSAQDRIRTARVETAAKNAVLPGLSARQGFRTGTFWRLVIGALAMSAAGGALTVNLVPILRAAGHDGTVAASLAGLSGLSAIVGRLSGGYLLDRLNARVLGAGAVLLPIVTVLVLLLAPTHMPLVIVGVIFSGLAAGAEMDAISYIATRSFGLRNFGLLFGALSGVLALGVGSGPSLANLVYDATGSYAGVLWAIIPLSLITSWMFFTVAPYPDFTPVSKAVPAADTTAQG